MKKQIKTLLVALLVIPCMVIFAACGDKKEDTTTDPVKLGTPSNLQISDTTLSWSAVSNASGYNVKIDSGNTADNGTATTFALTMTTPKTYTIYVQAYGDGTNYTTSEWASKTYTVEDETDPTIVASVTVSGDNAMPINTTKTFTANVLPSTATDKSVVWSVVSGTATITQDGELTPTAAGAIVIRATASNDVYGEKTINAQVTRQAIAPTIEYDETNNLFIVTNNEPDATWANYQFRINNEVVTVTDGTGENAGKKVYDMSSTIAGLGASDDLTAFAFNAIINSFTSNYGVRGSNASAIETYTFIYSE